MSTTSAPASAPTAVGGVLRRDEEPIARHLALRAGGSFERWVEVIDETALLSVVRTARAEKTTLRPVPPFCDALPPEGGLSGIALRLGRGFEFVRTLPDGVEVGAAAPLCLLGLHPGYAAFLRAPGTLTDAIEEGWIQPAVMRLRRLRGRGFEDVEGVPDLKGLVVSAVLRPNVSLVVPRAGAAFKELKRKGPTLRDVLKRARLGGLRVHGAGLAEDDPAVLVNRGEASARQLRLLLAVVKERVQSMTGIELEERLMAPGRGGRG